jgi:hypothetical protein
MRKAILLSLLLCWCGALVVAQQPGILGRKFIVGAVGTVGPPALFNTYRSKDFSKALSLPLWGVGLQLQYIVSRENALVFQFAPGAINYTENLDVGRIYVQERTLSFGLKYRTNSFEKAGNLAPMGFFTEFGVGINRVVQSGSMQLPFQEDPLNSTSFFEPIGIVGFGQGWLWRRIPGEFGLQVAVTPGMLRDDLSQSRVTNLSFVTLRLGIGLLN